MFNLRPVSEEHKEANAVLAILAGHQDCYLCGKATKPPRKLICDTCKWHTNRAKYHAVYCYALRGEHKLRDTQYSRNYDVNTAKCRRCSKFYGAYNSYNYAERENV